MTDEEKTKTHAEIIGILTALLDDSRNLSGLLVVGFKNGDMLFPAHVNMTQKDLANASSALQAITTRCWMELLDERYGAPK